MPSGVQGPDGGLVQGNMITTGPLLVPLYLLPQLNVEGRLILPKRLSWLRCFQIVSTWKLGKETRILFIFLWWYLGKFR